MTNGITKLNVTAESIDKVITENQDTYRQEVIVNKNDIYFIPLFKMIKGDNSKFVGKIIISELGYYENISRKDDICCDAYYSLKDDGTIEQFISSLFEKANNEVPFIITAIYNNEVWFGLQVSTLYYTNYNIKCTVISYHLPIPEKPYKYYQNGTVIDSILNDSRKIIRGFNNNYITSDYKVFTQSNINYDNSVRICRAKIDRTTYNNSYNIKFNLSGSKVIIEAILYIRDPCLISIEVKGLIETKTNSSQLINVPLYFIAVRDGKELVGIDLYLSGSNIFVQSLNIFNDKSNKLDVSDVPNIDVNQIVILGKEYKYVDLSDLLNKGIVIDKISFDCTIQ